MKNFPIEKTIKLKRNWLASKPVLIILIILMFFLGRSTWDIYGKYSLSRDNLRRTQTEEKFLKEQYTALSNMVAGLKTRRGVEEIIRRNLPMVKPGEKMIMVIDEEKENEEVTVAEFESETENWWDSLRFWRN